MGQKVHPLGFRLGITQDHRSQWFAKPKQYSLLVVEDHFLRQTIMARFPEAGIVSIDVQRKVDQIRIEVCAARPRVIVAFGGQDLDNLRRYLAQSLRVHRETVVPKTMASSSAMPGMAKAQAQIAIYITKLSNPNVSAGFLSDFLVEQLEKRIPFRRAMKSAVQRAQRAQIKGIKIQVAGRLNGAEIARSEWIRKGQVPLQTLRANVDYSYRTASTIYGLLGIKVWTFQGLADAKAKRQADV
jgi:small subunit ribosomal protein S3